MQLFRPRAGKTSAISDHANDVIAGPFKFFEARRNWPNARREPSRNPGSGLVRGAIVPVEVDMNCRDPEEIAQVEELRDSRIGSSAPILSALISVIVLSPRVALKKPAAGWIFLELMVAPSGLFRLKPVHGYC